MTDMFELVFFGDNGTFEYRYGASEFIEYLFRNPRLRGLSWTMDGEGWTSEPTAFPEAGVTGNWYVARMM